MATAQCLCQGYSFSVSICACVVNSSLRLISSVFTCPPWGSQVLTTSCTTFLSAASLPMPTSPSATFNGEVVVKYS